MATIRRDILLYNCITAKVANAQERRSRIVCRVVGHRVQRMISKENCLFLLGDFVVRKDQKFILSVKSFNIMNISFLRIVCNN